MPETEEKEVAAEREHELPIPDILPVLPLKDVVVFPFIILPLSVSREKSITAVDAALAEQRIIMLVAQRDAQSETPRPEELFPVGTVAAIMRMLKLPDGRIRLLVQGLSRARVDSFLAEEPYLKAKITKLEEPPTPKVLPPEQEALLRSVKQNLEKSVSLGKNISPEVMVIAANLDDPARLADLAASNLDLKLEDAQKVLESTDPIERLRLVNDSLSKEITVLTMQQEISSQARGEMDKSQREYYLRQQLRAIQQELGEGEEMSEDVAQFRKLVGEKKIPPEAATEIEKQIKRLERSHPDSAETAIIRTYLDWLTGLPWGNMSEDSADIDRAREILDEDHYDIEKVKERIIEYLAVHALKKSLKGPILCFVGPPGVGKTSLGRSIARALARKFVRLSLGGVRDEAEIRGHRRTYVGAMPGRIVQGIHQAGTSNPVFMLDEIDKIGADYRGDPSSALLEVLDPEQNFSFRDHYLGVPYDLSKVLFIATANILDPIQPAFLDRMEVIRLSGYTLEEKRAIARRHLIPKQLEENGIGEGNLEFTDSGVEKIIEAYTREAGLRNLEREIGAVCRKVAVAVAKGKSRRYRVTSASVEKMLGPVKHFADELLKKDEIGVATGLAWTSVGGDILFIEALAVRGKGGLRLTGQLGDVMKESAQAAMSYARAHAADLGIADDFFETHDVHVHVPEGSIPKDGPSAGITMATAMISAFTQRLAHRDVAMTGEITLRGEVLPIGGVKEKVLAARQANIKTIILPRLNKRDVIQVNPRILHGMQFEYVDNVDQVLDIALFPREPRNTAPAAGAPRDIPVAASTRPIARPNP
ncbi:MAG: endopeptidase La [Acidobacteria bacterium]|nr:endopeptidase La [Acidobacteriota bacterium]MCA1612108.1 endopeptidase La [Acidobacteriota bacterium]